VTKDPDRPQTDEVVLAHELVHVLQHQHYDLYQSKYDPPTLDGEFGKDGVVEGEATLVHHRYRDRCRGTWACVPTPAGWADPGAYSGPALPLLFYQPYADGPAYVHSLVESGGWAAVDAAHESLPASSEQIIHLTDEEPAPIALEDAATGGWQAVDVGESGTQRLDAFGTGESGPYDAHNYTSRPSAGWGNDRLRIYENGDRDGYVWKTVWDTERDAREFHEAYVGVLEANGATRVGESVRLIEDGPFADAFRVTRIADTVTIVNGPTVDALAAIRPRSTDATTVPATTTMASTTASTPTDRQPTATTSTSVETTDDASEDGTVPGFGAVVAVVALLIAVGATVAGRRRGR
jgi:hypothetical protein